MASAWVSVAGYNITIVIIKNSCFLQPDWAKITCIYPKHPLGASSNHLSSSCTDHLPKRTPWVEDYRKNCHLSLIIGKNFPLISHFPSVLTLFWGTSLTKKNRASTMGGPFCPKVCTNLDSTNGQSVVGAIWLGTLVKKPCLWAAHCRISRHLCPQQTDLVNFASLVVGFARRCVSSLASGWRSGWKLCDPSC